MKTMLRAAVFSGLLGLSALACSTASPPEGAESATRAAELSRLVRDAPPLRPAALERSYSELRSGRFDDFTTQDASNALQDAKRLLPDHAAAFDWVSAGDARQQLFDLRDAARSLSLEAFASEVDAKLRAGDGASQMVPLLLATSGGPRQHPVAGTLARGTTAPSAPSAPMSAAGGTGTCPNNVTFHGGGVMSNPRVALIFWGGYWQTDATGQQERAARDQATRQAEGNASWWAPLSEYGVASGSYLGAWVAQPNLAAGTLSQGAIGDGLTNEVGKLDNGTLVFPHYLPDATDVIYVIMLPPNTRSEYWPGYLGWHTQVTTGFLFWTTTYTYATVEYLSAWQTNSVISHEIEEAASDADASSGWYAGTVAGEIGDLCNGQNYSFNGTNSERLWSQRNCGCIGATTCGDGICGPYENATTCPQDCQGLVGCFADSSTRALATSLGNGQTIESCRAAARNRGLAYAGLEYYGECWASSSPTLSRLPDSACNLVCNANDFEGCGGVWAVRVFNSCTAGTYFCSYNNTCVANGATCWPPSPPPVCGDGRRVPHVG